MVSRRRRKIITALSTLSSIFYTLPTVRSINNTQNHCRTNYNWEKRKTPCNELHAIRYLQEMYNIIHIISRITKELFLHSRECWFISVNYYQDIIDEKEEMMSSLMLVFIGTSKNLRRFHCIANCYCINVARVKP